MINKLIQKTSLKKVILLGLFALSVYLIMIVFTIPTLVKQIDGLKTFDMRPLGYSFIEASQVKGAMNIDTIHYY